MFIRDSYNYCISLKWNLCTKLWEIFPYEMQKILHEVIFDPSQGQKEHQKT